MGSGGSLHTPLPHYRASGWVMFDPVGVGHYMQLSQEVKDILIRVKHPLPSNRSTFVFATFFVGIFFFKHNLRHYLHFIYFILLSPSSSFASTDLLSLEL